MSWYRKQLEDWLSEQEIRASTVYDIGGKQGPVSNRVRLWQVKNYKILDLPEFNIEEDEETEPADIIFCLEVFEYLIRPLEALYNIAASLKKGGKAYVTFAFVYPHHNELELDALRYTEPGIKRLAAEAGLTINNAWYRTDKSGFLQEFYAADRMHPAKQYGHHDATGFIVEFVK